MLRVTVATPNMVATPRTWIQRGAVAFEKIAVAPVINNTISRLV